VFNFLSLITNKKYWLLHSYIIKLILKLYGIRVGKSFYCQGTPKLKIAGEPKNIIIGDNVKFLGDIDLRNRENGKIIIEDNVLLESVRLVSAREGVIKIGKNSAIAEGTIINGGGDVLIGENVLISTYVTINANEHKMAKNDIIKNQGYIHKPVIIEDDCLIGAKVSINKNVTIKKGSIIGAGSVVTKDTKEYKIYAGVPAKEIGERKYGN
jgi:acetyltransferase-like isoleucine patch superfamily enzyme